MTVSAKVIEHSVSGMDMNSELLTMQLRYPKFIHAEAKTHRIMYMNDILYEFFDEVGFMDEKEFSRNASSSRAIPVSRLIADVRRDPVIPSYWGMNQAGMQAKEELTGAGLEIVKGEWIGAMEDAIRRAEAMAAQGAHKQLVNRIIEPYSHINVIVTATNYANFYALRRHEDAQPEIRALADAMWEAHKASTPRLLHGSGLNADWHLPYVTEGEIELYGGRTDPRGILRKLSTARCARVSYVTHEGKAPNVEEDTALFQRLIVAAPLHASPTEHQAFPDVPVLNGWRSAHNHGNLTGFIQHRKLLANECVYPLFNASSPFPINL